MQIESFLLPNEATLAFSTPAIRPTVAQAK